ncbi:unnamed protein product [Anisakis simplex]|uniref:Uncharacterized protein n=1 Tax=Anisakis simplex TaxID=6269 RepID=A0A0M3JXX2_ANISI|nr:unnamed protein product [Anisakis simplex]
MAMRGIDSSADIEPNIESHLPPLNPLPPPPAATRATALRAAALTRTFRSEPHLDIPHFVHGQDPLHVSSLTRVLSGLTQVDSALSTPFSSSKRCLDSGVNSCPHPQVVVDDSA